MPYPMIRDYFAKKNARRSRRTQKKAQNIKLARAAGIVQPGVSAMPWAYWRDKADDMWAMAIKTLAKRAGQIRCRRCNIKSWDSACHIIPRGKYATRYLLRNGYAGCSGCNDGERWHRLEYREHHIKMIGHSEYEALTYIANFGNSKFDRDQMKSIYEVLKRVVEGGTMEAYQDFFDKLFISK